MQVNDNGFETMMFLLSNVSLNSYLRVNDASIDCALRPGLTLEQS